MVLPKCKHACTLPGGAYDEVETCGYCKIHTGVTLGCTTKSPTKVELLNLATTPDETDKSGSDYCGDFSLVTSEASDFE